MIFTARQLEDLHRTNGHVTLPYRARLTPLAQDWVKAKKIVVGYSDMPAGNPPAAAAPAAGSSIAGSPVVQDAPAGAFLWWCDGPCGPAKAALMTAAKEAPLSQIQFPEDPARIVAVIKRLAEQIGSGRAAGGVLMIQAGARPMLYANRCPALRAVMGTCLEAVEQGIQQAAANVLVIEHPHKTMQQVRNMVGRFVRGRRDVPDELSRHLRELASCE